MKSTDTVNRQRLVGFMRKEVIQVWRDPSSIVVAIILPLILLFLFGYGVSLDARNLPLAVVIETDAPEARDFLAGLKANHYVTPQRVENRDAANHLLDQSKVFGILIMGADFGEKLTAGTAAPIQVLVNGTDANTARIMASYVQGAWMAWRTQRGYAHPEGQKPLIQMQARVWFNPSLDSHRSIVPGLMAVIMTLIGAFLTALVVAREWERGTMEALLTTPLTKAELLIGKMAPYFVLGMAGMAVSVALGLIVFDVGFRGSFLVLIFVSACFLLGVLALGLMFSTITRNQFAAAILAITATMMPTILLSGFIFDIRSMPAPIQLITYLVPARYFVEVLKTLFLAGNIWSVIIPNTLALIGISAVLLTITTLKTRRKLE